MIKFKNKEDQMLFSLLHPYLILVAVDMYIYAKNKHGIDIVFTDTISTPEQDLKLKRKSNSHQYGISLDFRTRDIDAFVLQDIVNYIESKPEYKKYKYLSYSGKKRLIHLHDSGNGHHGHMQIHRKYSIQNIQEQVADLVH